jgi:hypothetical protein
MIQVTEGHLGAAVGRQGGVYVIPVRSAPIGRKSGPMLPLPMIRYFVGVFLNHARHNPDDKFKVSVIGKPYKVVETAPMFDYAPWNVYLPYEYQC